MFFRPSSASLTTPLSSAGLALWTQERGWRLAERARRGATSISRRFRWTSRRGALTGKWSGWRTIFWRAGATFSRRA